MKGKGFRVKIRGGQMLLEPKSQCLCDACDACWKIVLFGLKSQVNKQIRGGCDVQFVWRLFSSLKAAFPKVTPAADSCCTSLAHFGSRIDDPSLEKNPAGVVTVLLPILLIYAIQRLKRSKSSSGRGFPFPSFSQECEQSCDIDQQHIRATSVKP